MAITFTNKKIAVLGAGTMGAGIAQCFAQSGYDVLLRDIKQEYCDRGIAGIAKNLDRSVQKNKMTAEERDQIIGRIRGTTEIKDLADCGLVIEAAVENMAIKKEIFKELDSVCNEDTIFATNTSSLSITEVAAATNRPNKVIGMHFFNPAPVMKLIEIISGIATDKDVLDAIYNLSKEIGKGPVQVEEAPGFVVNRILIPMINEGIGILADGVATKEDIDEAMKMGANHPIGPLALADLIGNDVVLAIMNVLYEEFGDTKYRPHPLLKKMVRGNLLGRKTKAGFYNY